MSTPLAQLRQGSPPQIVPPARTNWLELGACLLLLGAFVFATLQAGSPLMRVFAEAKWFVFLGIIYLACLRILAVTWRVSVNLTNLLFLSFVFFATISTISSSQSFDEGLRRCFSFWCLYLFAYVFAWPTDPDKRIDLWTYAALLLCGAVVCASSVSALAGGGFIQGRMRGIMENANTLGSVAAMLVAGCFGQLQPRRQDRDYLLKALMVLGFLCILFSQSRASLVAAAAGLFSICVLRRKKVLMVALLAVGCVVFAPQEKVTFRNLGQIGQRQLSVRSITLRSRSQIWSKQLEAWQRRPLIGHGLQLTGWTGQGRIGGVSSYFDLLGAVGLLGAAPFFGGLLVGTLILFRLAKAFDESDSPPQSGRFHASALAMVTVILVNSLGEGFMAAVGAMQPIYVWIVLAAASQVRRPAAPALYPAATIRSCT